MAATQPTPALPAQPPPDAANPAESADTSRPQALVRAEAFEEEPEAPFASLVLGLPVELDVSVPVRDFRVRDLLALGQGQVIESEWNSGMDLPLAAGDVQLAWTEFEVVDTKMAVRVTRVA
jgi:flagellar motor switch protein FliN